MSWNPQIKNLKNKKTPLPFSTYRDVQGNWRYHPVEGKEKEAYQEPIKQTHCANCGAPLNPAKSRCEYCKSYYKEDTECYILESL